MKGGISTFTEIQMATHKNGKNIMSLRTKTKTKSLHGMSLNDVKKQMSRTFTTSKELLVLSNLLNNAENKKKVRSGREITVLYEGKKRKINPKYPPAFITYEMLLNEKLEEDDVGIPIEPTKKRRNMLRIKWWNAWYKIITGYYSVERAEKSQQGGGFDFDKARDNLVKKIKKTASHITDENIRKMAEETLRFRNVKLLKPVKKTLPTQKKIVVNEVNEDTMDIDNFKDTITVSKARRLTESGVKKARLAIRKEEWMTNEEKDGYIVRLVNDEKVKEARTEAQRQHPSPTRSKKSSVPPPATKSVSPVRPQTPPVPPPVSRPALTIQQIEADLKRIKEQILRNADDSKRQYGETLRERFVRAFNTANSTIRAKNKIKEAYVKKYVVDNLTDYSGEPRKMSYTNGTVELYRIMDNLRLYGMQLPPQFDRRRLLGSMLYMIGEEGIYSIVDLQDCVGTNINHPDIEYSIGCNPYDMGSSEEIYNRVMGEIAPSEARVYRRVNNYYDMSPGFPSAWDRISKIGDTRDDRNSVAVHCLAGKGRTGSVLLYLYIRDSMPEAAIRRRLGSPHFGYADISEFIYYLNEGLFNDPSTDMYKGYKRDVSREIFRIGFEVSMCGLTSSILFRQRINRVLLYIARDKGVESFWCYGRPIGLCRSAKDEFNNPRERRIDWGTYDSDRYESDIFD
jgi:hypothetical protein